MKTKIIEKFHLTFTQSSKYAVSFCKWLVCSTGIGLICGLIGSLFYKSIEYVTFIREANPTLIYFLPFAGLIIVWLYNRLGVRHDRGTNLILDSIHSHEQIPTALAPLIYIGTTITHLFGGSSGREGAALQMGGCIGVTLGKRLHMSEKDINVLTMCGMSAVFTAMFGTPITATIFSMEVISVGVFHYSAFVPCVLASTTAYGISTLFSIQGETFLLTEVPSITISTSAKIILLSILCGIIAIIFCQLIHGTLCLFRKYLTNHYLRIFIGGSIVSFILFLSNSQIFCGAGFNLIEDAVYSKVSWSSLIIKVLLTAITLGCGFKGGEIVPALCTGALFGNLIAPVLGLNPSFGAAIGLICLFCGVVNCPIAAIILSIEMFGQQDPLLFCIACGVSYVFSGCFGLYKSQKILYSKIHAEYINTHSH